MCMLECLLSQRVERLNANQDEMKICQEDVTLEGHYGDHQLMAAYCFQLSSESA
jgi:hypothetical protein